MIYLRIKNEFGTSYGAYNNLAALKKRIKKQDLLFKGTTIDDCVKYLNAERITAKEYYDAIL